FYARESAERERSGLPPFGRLAAIIVSAPSRAEAESYGRTLRAAAPVAREIEIYGPAEAPMALVRGRHRFRLLVHATRSADVQAYLRPILANAARPRGGVPVPIEHRQRAVAGGSRILRADAARGSAGGARDRDLRPGRGADGPRARTPPLPPSRARDPQRRRAGLSENHTGQCRQAARRCSGADR